MRISNNKFEQLAIKWLEHKGMASEQNIIRHYPDLYDVNSKKFYEIKLFRQTSVTDGRIYFSRDQIRAFKLINPNILVFKMDNMNEPIINLPFNEMIMRYDLPFIPYASNGHYNNIRSTDPIYLLPLDNLVQPNSQRDFIIRPKFEAMLKKEFKYNLTGTRPNLKFSRKISNTPIQNL